MKGTLKQMVPAVEAAFFVSASNPLVDVEEFRVIPARSNDKWSVVAKERGACPLLFRGLRVQAIPW